MGQVLESHRPAGHDNELQEKANGSESKVNGEKEHPAAIPIERLMEECEVVRTRASGPGGQRRNKVETAVVVSHKPTGISASASERRNQAENQRKAVFRLRVNLAVEIRRPVTPESHPTSLWQSRCSGGRIAINPRHRDFPSILAEALDVLAYNDWDMTASAKFLGCSATQLVKLLRNEPRALGRLNEERKKLGLGRLR
jgi:hypothetical protein